MIGLLEGVVVLDLSRILAGPWTTQLFGDLGATVIKIEKPGSGDDTRTWGPPFVKTNDGDEGDAAYFLSANRNKKSVTIDFTKPEGAELVRTLAQRADVLVENFKVGGLAKYGLDYETLHKLNPKLVYCSITGFGQEGPYANQAGYDPAIQAIGGLMSVTGEPEGAPMKTGVAIADLFSGMYAATAIIAALRHAERTGVGQHLDVSLFDCQVAMLANQAANYLVSGETPARLGNVHPNIAPFAVFETEDDLVVIAVGNDEQFARFCAVMGVSEEASNPQYRTNKARVANREALTSLINSRLRRKPASAWLDACRAEKIPAAPINNLKQVFDDPHLKARGIVETFAQTGGAPVSYVSHPVRYSAMPTNSDSSPPRLAEHTDEILKGFAELPDAALQDLKSKKII